MALIFLFQCHEVYLHKYGGNKHEKSFNLYEITMKNQNNNCENYFFSEKNYVLIEY